MKNVYLGQLAGRDRFNPALLSLGLHYGFKPLAAPPRAGWVKGKVERPFDYIREGFWRGYHFSDLLTANKDLGDWLGRKRERVHGTQELVTSILLNKVEFSTHVSAVDQGQPTCHLG
jgi:transposase